MNTQSSNSDSNSSSGKSNGMALKLFVIVMVILAGIVGALYVVGGNELVVEVSEEFKGETGQSFKLTGKVFKAITEPEMIKKWAEGTTKIEQILEDGGDVPGHRVGAKSLVTVEHDGNTVVFIDEVVKTRVNQELELKMTSGEMDGIQNFKITYKDQKALAGDTIVLTHTFRVKFKTPMGRIMSFFAKSPIEKQLQKNLASLKKLVEKGDVDKAK